MSPVEILEQDIVIAFMGPTGTGKSFFIDLLTGEEGKRARGDLVSVTQDVDASYVIHPQTGKRVVLVDTPGFDDTNKTELQVLKLLADWLEKTYRKNIKLCGIVYLHCITDRRMQGSTLKNLNMFKCLCGDAAMSRVVLTTTMWKDVEPELGEDRQIQLEKKFWLNMISHGASVDRLKSATHDEAWRVVDGLIGKHTTTSGDAIQLQSELVDLKRSLNQTEAGKAVYASHMEFLRRVESRRKEILQERKQSRDVSTLKILDAELAELGGKIKKARQEVAKLKERRGWLNNIQTLLRLIKVEGEGEGNGTVRIIRGDQQPSEWPETMEAQWVHIENITNPIITKLSAKDISPGDMVIAFMGPTGTGKSTFIDLLTSQERKRSRSVFESVTHRVEAIGVPHPQTGKRIVFVDTPGFDDTCQTELEVLRLISSWLVATHERNVGLSGIVYLHSIAECRMTGSTLKNLEMFEHVCGDGAMARVVLTTTKWRDVKPEVGDRREAQLESNFWQPLIKQGATMDRLKQTDYNEAWRVINGLIEKRNKCSEGAVRLQKELISMEKQLIETAAGKAVYVLLQEGLNKAQDRSKAVLHALSESQDSAMVEGLERELAELRNRIHKMKVEVAQLQSWGTQKLLFR